VPVKVKKASPERLEKPAIMINKSTIKKNSNDGQNSQGFQGGQGDAANAR